MPWQAKVGKKLIIKRLVSVNILLFQEKFLQNMCPDLKKNKQVCTVSTSQKFLAAALTSPFSVLATALCMCVWWGRKVRKNEKKNESEKELEWLHSNLKCPLSVLKTLSQTWQLV